MAGILAVTGGSRGIGAAVARAAAARGYSVAVNYKTNRARAEAVVAAIAESGGRAIAVAGDVAREADVLRLFETVDRELGPITALVNSAGVPGPVGRLDACAAADLDSLFATNVTGVILCCREAIRRMSTKHGGKGGAIVSLSSALSRLGGAGELVPYAATKGAIDTLTAGLAREVAGEGVRVNAVRPGVISTELQPAERLERIGPTLPMRRPGTAEEIAEAILWLLSDNASYVTGAIVDVSGGR